MNKSQLAAQLELELEMRARGKERYYAETTSAEMENRGSETTYARKLIPAYFLPLADIIQKYLSIRSAGHLGKYKSLIRGCTPEQCAFFTLQVVFNSIMNGKQLQHVANAIGTRLEDEQRFALFYTKNPGYVQTILDNWEDSKTKSQRHRSQTLSAMMTKQGHPWNKWTNVERMQVGLGLLDCVQKCSNILLIKSEFIRGKTYTMLYPTPECLEWIQTHTELMSVLRPQFTPCIVPPQEWTSLYSGGYYSPDVQDIVPLVKFRSPIHKKKLEEAELSVPMEALNILQNTGYSINNRVLGVLKDVWKSNAQIDLPPTQPYSMPKCPFNVQDKSELNDEELLELKAWKSEMTALHTLETARVSKCLQTVRVLQLAEQYRKTEAFWYPLQMDFRGRVYTTVNGLSPQGTGFSKSLLHFVQEKPVTSDNAYRWFLIHGANCYGFDKLTFDGRVQAIQTLHKQIITIANDPLGARDLWKDADDPWMFLAWAFEYSDIHTNGKTTSRLPVFLDGSCNGLQHFSALLRDSHGARFTNVSPSDKPSDIYQEVADKVNAKLLSSTDQTAKEWLEFKVTRVVTKKPVMTLPYGATKQNCVYSIVQSILDSNTQVFSCTPFKAALYLAPIVWESIESTVESATTAMSWLKGVASTAARAKVPMMWTPPNGLPVVHASYEVDVMKIKSILSTQNVIKIGAFSDRLALHKMVNGASPNFVHSLDASHLMATVTAGARKGLTSIACVHDSFGTHACDTGTLHKCIQEEFYNMYSSHDPLQELKNTMEEFITLPDVPIKGDLDIATVLESEYIFS